MPSTISTKKWQLLFSSPPLLAPSFLLFLVDSALLLQLGCFGSKEQNAHQWYRRQGFTFLINCEVLRHRHLQLHGYRGVVSAALRLAGPPITVRQHTSAPRTSSSSATAPTLRRDGCSCFCLPVYKGSISRGPAPCTLPLSSHWLVFGYTSMPCCKGWGKGWIWCLASVGRCCQQG